MAFAVGFLLALDLATLKRYDFPALALDPRAEVHARADHLSVAWPRLMARAIATA